MTARVYLDTAPVIYAVEQVPHYAERVASRLTAPDTVLFASDLTRMECRVKPLRDGDDALLADYDQFLAQVVAETVSLSRAV